MWRQAGQDERRQGSMGLRTSCSHSHKSEDGQRDDDPLNGWLDEPAIRNGVSNLWRSVRPIAFPRCTRSRRQILELLAMPSFDHDSHQEVTVQIRDIMTPNPRTVQPSDTLQAAAQAMDELNVGVLPVCEGERLVGLVTDRDIVIRSVSAGQDPRTATVADAMTTGPRTMNRGGRENSDRSLSGFSA